MVDITPGRAYGFFTDTSVCIGCKACMQACPYDAIFIKPQDHSAEKCNFCAHRIDVGLEPSCVIVCPTHSIWAGDLDDPTSAISRLVARNDVAVRAPEQGTRPKVFYKGADRASLDPTRTAIAADGMIWAEATAGHPTPPVPDPAHQVARTAYTTAHPTPWGWRVSTYLVTKAIGAGAMLVAALLVLLGHAGAQAPVGVLAPVVAGAFIALTGALLVADLKQPGRFHYILTRPNWGSWLTRGAVILAGFAALTRLVTEVPALAIDISVAATNKAPVSSIRGAGYEVPADAFDAPTGGARLQAIEDAGREDARSLRRDATIAIG